MELDRFAEKLGTIVTFFASRRASDQSAAVAAVREINQDSAARSAYATFLETAGIDMMSNPSFSVFRFFPNSKDSPFSFDSNDFKRGVKADNSALYAFAMLCTLATFYPSRSAITQNIRSEVRVEDVVGTIREMTEFADRPDGRNVSEVLTTLADRFKSLADDTGELTNNKGFKSTYVRSAIAQLVEHNLIKEMEGGKYYLPTEALRLLTADRINFIKCQMAEILSDFYDYVEAATLNQAEQESE